MNAPSRTMPPPPLPKKVTVVGWGLFATLLACLAWGLITSGSARWAFVGISALAAVLTVLRRRRLSHIKEGRKTESICSFARALPARDHDTWVIRAVYEELSRMGLAPLRPSDDLKKFWGVDPEDLDDVAVSIAHRARRSLDKTVGNPLYGRAVTVGDLILFFEHQPKLSGHDPS
jgi:hypothetical protein